MSLSDDHAEEARKLLRLSAPLEYRSPAKASLLAEAQVHATLSLRPDPKPEPRRTPAKKTTTKKSTATKKEK